MRHLGSSFLAAFDALDTEDAAIGLGGLRARALNSLVGKSKPRLGVDVIGR
jgi:hypothetical protein